MAGDQRRSVVVYCVEVASVTISGKEEAKQAEQWEVGHIFPATELLSLRYAWLGLSLQLPTCTILQECRQGKTPYRRSRTPSVERVFTHRP